jgi:enterochelin esterase family protein
MHRSWPVLFLIIAVALATSPALASDEGGQVPAPLPESATLRDLASSLSSHDAHALDVFWDRVRKRHTPLIETVPGHPDEALFTFLWRGEPGQVALNVLFNGWFPLHANRGFDTFTRLADSNVWYTSYTLPKTAQIRYELISPKGWHAAPDRVTYFTMDGTEYETFHDPLNPDLLDWNNSVTSHAQGPDAKTSSFLKLQNNVPKGHVESLDVESRILGNKRTLKIYLPPGYSSSREYGWLLAYDGNQYTTAVPTPTILDNMIASKALPPIVAVFLESPDRDVEFPPNDDFQRFIGTELMAQLRAHYRLSRDASHNAVLGSSYGGLAATYTALSHPDLFGNVISQSGSYGWSPPPAGDSAPQSAGPPRGTNPDSGWLIKRAAEMPRLKIRFYLDAGLWEGGMLSSNRLLRSVLTGKGYDVTYVEAPGTHSSYYWMLRLPDGLQSTLGQNPRR